ncbi:MAG: CAP domain-containing protein [Solirubrobacteraceae bacterium]
MTAPRTLLGAACAAAALALAPAAASAVSWPGAAGAAPADAAYAAEMVGAINRLRARHGLGALAASVPLARGAGAHSRSMVRYGYIGHARKIRPAGFRLAGEIIEWHDAPRARVALALRMWMHSATHRRLLLDGRFRYVGAGTATGRHWRIWTVRFGAK